MKDFEQFKKDLFSLISFKSVNSVATKDAPFGKENADALNFFLDKAREFGFDTINYDNYIGEVSFGTGEEVGIIGHLDVVPEGNDWDTDPFTLTEKEGYFFGRGVMDDKTPTLISLYVLKELKDSALPVNKKFRLFVGCNEETGWNDIEYLKTKTTLPEYGFSPDGNFPLSYAEKGMYEIEFSIPSLKNFSSLKGGTVVNAVCAHATATANESGIDKKLIEKFGLKLKNNNVVESIGVSAHGSTPQRGKNALKPIFEYFKAMGEDVEPIVDYLFNDKAGVTSLNNEQGFVTLSPDILYEKNGKVYINCDCRIPAPLTINDVRAKLDASNLNYSVFERHKPMLVEKDGWFVKTLLSAYNTITGENAQPISMGGSTFARAFKKGCAFGMDFCRYDSNIHNANEKVSKDDLLSAYKIYKKAIFDLAKL